MSNEGFFPGIEFSQLKEATIITKQLEPSETGKDSDEKVIISFGDYGVDDLEIEAIVPWEFGEVLHDFGQTLACIERQNALTLPLHDRHISLVKATELLPTSDAARERLVAWYGKYVLDGIAGDCRREEDGTFRIRIGSEGEEATSDKSYVLGVLAHEYGHTLGESLDLAIEEELKAYAFQSLFLKHHFPDELFLIDGLSPDKVHDVARNRLAQLTEVKGISEEAILAHLTGEQFGTFTPDSYREAMWK